MSKVKQLVNSLPDKRPVLALLQAFDMVAGSAAVTANGTSSQANSAALTKSAVQVLTTSSASTKGVRFQPCDADDPGQLLINTSATYDILVYPDVGGQINALGTNAAYTLPAAQAAFFIPSTAILRYAGIVGATSAQIAYLTGSSTTVTASKAVIADSSKDVATLRNVTATGTVTGLVATAPTVNAGESGTAGTVNVFPTTATQGKLSVTVTDQTGDTTVGLVVGAMATARTITIRDPGAAASLLTTTDATAAATTATAAEITAVVAGNAATAAEITRSADASARIVNTTATTLALTVTQHAERVVLLNASSTTNIFTLPVAAGTGAKFTVINNFAQTQGTIVVAANGTDVISGVCVNVDNTGATATKAFSTTASSDKLTLDRTTTGGALVGDMIECWDQAANTWKVRVAAIGSGAIATPFSQT